MRKIVFSVLACLVVFAYVAENDADARKNPRRSGKSDSEEVKDTASAKTPYMKFREKKGLKTESGFVTIYKDGKDIYVEIPDSVFGSKVISSTRVKSSQSLQFYDGMSVSDDNVYLLDRTDSLVLFRGMAKNIVVEDEDESISRALGRREPVVFAMPVKYRNADSTAVVIEAGKLFDYSDKKVLDMTGRHFDDNRIYEADYKSELTVVKDVVSFGFSVGVVKEATFELSFVGPMGGALARKESVSADFISSLTLLPDESMPRRKADDRIGTRKVAYTAFKSDGGTETGHWASRWHLVPQDTAAVLAGGISDVSEPIRIYVDTLLGPSWSKAVADGIMAWEPAFEAAGLGNAIAVTPYPADRLFHVEDPLNSCVSLVGGSGGAVSATVFTDKTTGRILSCRIAVPADYIQTAYKTAVFAISDVDTRYQSYHLQDDAVCEVLRAQVMKLFGQCLGLSRNMAGSRAYSPEQLRDPSFTSEHGITSSVTDDVLFNYMAEPGDRERGVATITDRIGAYDKLAVEWLYRPFGDDEEAALDSLLASVEGKPEYLYIPVQSAGDVADPRGIGNDLGNDIFAAYNAGISHLKFVAANADKWISGDDVPDTFKSLFAEWLWLRFMNLNNMLSTYPGGIMTNDLRSGAPKTEPLPESVQKRAVYTVAGNVFSQPWIDANKTLLHLGGLTRTVSEFSRTAAISQFCRVFNRLSYVAMAAEEAGSAYSPEEYLEDLQSIFLKNVRKGRIEGRGEEYILRVYMNILMGYSPVMKQNFTDAEEKGTSAFALTGVRPEIGGISANAVKNLESLCYDSMKEVRRAIRTGISACRDSYTRLRLEYLLSMADAALGNRK